MNFELVDNSIKFKDGIDILSIPIEAIDNRLRSGEDTEALTTSVSNCVRHVERFSSNMYIPDDFFQYAYMYGKLSFYTNEEKQINNQKVILNIFTEQLAKTRQQRVISSLLGYGGMVVGYNLPSGTPISNATTEELVEALQPFIKERSLEVISLISLALKFNIKNNKLCIYDNDKFYFIGKDGKFAESKVPIIPIEEMKSLFAGCNTMFDILNKLMVDELCESLNDKEFRENVYKIIVYIVVQCSLDCCVLSTFSDFNKSFREAINPTTAINIYKNKDIDTSSIPMTVADCMDSQVLLKMIYNIGKEAYRTEKPTVEVTVDNVDDYISKLTPEQRVIMYKSYKLRVGD